MKKLLTILTCLIVTLNCFSQNVQSNNSFIFQPTTNPVTTFRIKGIFSSDSAIYLPIRENNWTPTRSGAIQFAPTQSALYYYNLDSAKWLLVGSGSGGGSPPSLATLTPGFGLIGVTYDPYSTNQTWLVDTSVVASITYINNFFADTSFIFPFNAQERTNDPPASPADSTWWLIGDAPTGIWITHENQLAQRLGTGYSYSDEPVSTIVNVITPSQQWQKVSDMWELKTTFIVNNGNLIRLPVRIGTQDDYGLELMTHDTTRFGVNNLGDLNYYRWDADTSTAYTLGVVYKNQKFDTVHLRDLVAISPLHLSNDTLTCVGCTGGGGSGVQSVTGNITGLVNNTDPLNPIVNAWRFGIEDNLGLQNRSVDIQGFNLDINGLTSGFGLDQNYSNLYATNTNGDVSQIENDVTSGRNWVGLSSSRNTIPGQYNAEFKLNADSATLILVDNPGGNNIHMSFVKPNATSSTVPLYYIPLTVNGNQADNTGNITISTGGTGTVTSVAALTLGTTGTDLSSTVANPTTTPVITLNVPTASASNRGALSSTDWTTFNNKQATISVTTPITLTGASVGMVNQGTTTTLLHGNASGNPSFGQVVNADITNATIVASTKLSATGTPSASTVLYGNDTWGTINSITGSGVANQTAVFATTNTLTGKYSPNPFYDSSVASKAVATWTVNTTAPDGLTYSDNAWSPALGLFAAPAFNGAFVKTSPDGVNWTVRTAPSNSSWHGIAWWDSVGIFVCVGDNAIMTSPDGITWTARTPPNSNKWDGICIANWLHLIVAVAYTGTGNRVMTSPDGITWTARTSAADNNWSGVASSDEQHLLVAVANSGTGNRVMTSTDAMTWTIGSISTDRDWDAVKWYASKSVWVAVGYTSGVSNNAMTSPDGITWTLRTTPSNSRWTRLACSNELGMLAATGAPTASTANVMTSPDGITWTAHTTTNEVWGGIAPSPELGIFSAVSWFGTSMISTQPAQKNYLPQIFSLPSTSLNISTPLSLTSALTGVNTTLNTPSNHTILTLNSVNSFESQIRFKKNSVDKFIIATDINTNGTGDFSLGRINAGVETAGYFMDTVGNVALGGNASNSTLRAMYIPASTSLVGIGCVPSFALDVQNAATAIAHFKSTATHTQVIIDATSTKNSNLQFQNAGANKWYVQNNEFVGTSDRLAFANSDANGNTEVFTLLQTGNVGVNNAAPTSKLQVTGSLAIGYVAKTSNYTATISDHTIECTSGTFTVTLPTAVGITGRQYTITNSGSGTITIGTTSSQTFTNITSTPTTLTLAPVGAGAIVSYTVESNNATWIVTGKVKNE